MKLIIILFNLCLFLYSIYHIFRTIFFTSKIKKNTSLKNNSKANLVILIPCLNEQKVITNTIKYFNEVCIKNFGIPIILITTNKEKKIKDNLTTKELIEEEILTKYSNVFLINYPCETGNMANQLNYAIKKINEKLNNPNDTYVSVYNADSLPSKDTINEFYNVVKKNNFPFVIQQYSYCFSNLEQLNLILKGFAIYQSNFELKMGLLNTYFDNILHKHVVGHGLYLRLDLINKMNGFNTKYWCEDIYLSAYLQNEKIKITPLLSLENMETASGLINLIKQNGVWFKTSFNCFKLYNDIKKRGKLSIHGKIGLLNEFRSWINWLTFPIIYLLIICLSLISNSWLLLILTILNYLIYVFIYYMTTIKIINKLDKQNHKFNLKIYLGTLGATLISNLGPLYSIFFNPKEKHKTNR